MYSTSTTESGLQDVSPDFYAWVFPKCDHVAVGTGTVIDKKGIQRLGELKRNKP
jgi:geranylgeranyl reductase